MQRLLYNYQWDADLVRDDLKSYVTWHLADADGVLAVDETGDTDTAGHRITERLAHAGPGLTAILNQDGSIALASPAPDDGSVTSNHVLLCRPKEGEETLIIYVSVMSNTTATCTDAGTGLFTR